MSAIQSREGAAAPEEVWPSMARLRILGEHQSLRGLFDKVLELAQRSEEGDAGATMVLREFLPELGATLRGHFAFEYEVLVPMLEGLDAWGQIRIQRLEAEHAQQEQLISDILEQAEGMSLPPRELTRLARGLIGTLLEDMKQEELHLLTLELFKDDSISVEFGG